MALIRWQATVQDEAGNAIVSPSVTVRKASDNSLADIYDDNGDVKLNPFFGSTEGFAFFNAVPGAYIVEGASGATVTPDWKVYLVDPSDIPDVEPVVQDVQAYSPAVTRVAVDTGTLTYRHVPSIAGSGPSHLVIGCLFNDGSASESQPGQRAGFWRSVDNGFNWSPKQAELVSATYSNNPLSPETEGDIQGEIHIAYDAVADQEIACVSHRGGSFNAGFICFRNAIDGAKWTNNRILFSTADNSVSLSSVSISGTPPLGFKRTITIDGIEREVVPFKPTFAQDGRMVIPLLALVSFGNNHDLVFLIRDTDGAWSVGGQVERGSIGAAGIWEPTLWEALDGTWYCQIRNITSGSSSADNHAVSASSDLRSWSPLEFLNEDIHSNRNMKIRGENFWYGTGVTHYTNRNALSLSVSGDGTNWVHGFTYGNEDDVTDFTHYSDIAEINGTIYAAYTEEVDQVTSAAPNELHFARFVSPLNLPIMGSRKNYYETGAGVTPSVSGSELAIPAGMSGSIVSRGKDFLVTLTAKVTVTPNANSYKIASIGDEKNRYLQIEYRDNAGACELWCGGVFIETINAPTEYRTFQIAVSLDNQVVSVLGQSRPLRRDARVYLGDVVTGAAQSGSIIYDASKCFITTYENGLPMQYLPGLMPINGGNIYAISDDGSISIGTDVATGQIGTVRFRAAGATKASVYWHDGNDNMIIQVAGVNVAETTSAGFNVLTGQMYSKNSSGPADVGVDAAVGSIASLRHRINNSTKSSLYWNDATSKLVQQVAGVNLVEYTASLVKALVDAEFTKLTVNGAFVTGPATTLTIASDAIAITGTMHRVDTEAGAATDDIVTINGGVTGQILILQSVNSARDIVIKNGTGNIFCGADRTLNTIGDVIVLRYNGAAWHMLSYADN